jgi:hypothetical protein
LLADRYRTPSLTNNWLIGFVVVLVSFLITFWLTAPNKPSGSGAPPPPQTPLAIFKSISVADAKSLSAAAALARLKPSANLKGFVEQISRSKDGKVKISGWAMDLEGQGAPIAVLVFVAGNYVFEAQTKGPRSDVAKALKASDVAASNVSFEGTFACNPGLPLFVVAVTQANTYSATGHPEPFLCPS